MSSVSRRGLLERIRRGKTAREQLVSSNLSEGIAFQIRATRDAQDMTQDDLAIAAGMSQNNISRLESPDYGRHTITSLKRIADALDVALIVRFVPFSQYINWLSSTPHYDPGLSHEALAVPSFSQEEKLHRLEDGINDFKNYYWEPTINVIASNVTANVSKGIPAQNPVLKVGKVFSFASINSPVPASTKAVA